MPSLVNRQVESIGEYLLLIVLYGGKLWFVYILFVMITVWTFLFIYKGQGRRIILGLFAVDVFANSHIHDNILLVLYLAHYSMFFLIGHFLR